MALRRQIACGIGLLVGAVLLMGCGSTDSPNAEIDPLIAQEFTDKLTLIDGYTDEGDCDKSVEALGTLKEAVDDRAAQNGEQFTADLQEMLDRLGDQIDEECEPVDQTTTETTDTEPTDTEPTETTDTEPTETTDTEPSTTTTESTTTTTDQTPPPNPTPPTTPPGGGPPENPGGGISPGGKKQGNDG